MYIPWYDIQEKTDQKIVINQICLTYYMFVVLRQPVQWLQYPGLPCVVPNKLHG